MPEAGRQSLRPYIRRSLWGECHWSGRAIALGECNWPDEYHWPGRAIAGEVGRMRFPSIRTALAGCARANAIRPYRPLKTQNSKLKTPLKTDAKPANRYYTTGEYRPIGAVPLRSARLRTRRQIRYILLGRSRQP